MADAVEVLTIGYQGRSVESFLDALEGACVDVLVDIRSKPMSRKPGFSKTALSGHLALRGIAYRHMPDLGMPLDLLASKASLRDNAPILDAYRAQMPDRTAAIDLVCVEAAGRRVCLLCFEADVSQCHRGVVADHLREERRLAVRHL